MSESWNEHAKNWDRDQRVRSFADQAFASLIEHVNVRHDHWKRKRILDFGCGTGLLSEKLAPLVDKVVAVDTSPDMIDVLRRKEIDNVTAICANIDDPDVHSHAPWFSGFDLIVASSVCGFLPNYAFTIGVLSKALSANGFFVQWDWYSTGNDVFGLTIARISDAFEDAGLKCLYVGAAFAVTFEDGESPVLMGVAAT